MRTHQPLHCQVALTNKPELLMAQRLLQRSEHSLETCAASINAIHIAWRAPHANAETSMHPPLFVPTNIQPVLHRLKEERVERLPRIRVAGNAEDVLVRREHLQNGETNTNGQRLHRRGYSIGSSYVMLQNGRTPYVQSIEKLSPRDHRP